MLCSQKFDILLIKRLFDLSILLSSISIYLMYVWGQSIVSSHIVCILQRNALPIICSAKFNNHTTQLFRKMKIIKFVDLVSVENFIFICKCISCNLYSVFSHLYILANCRHNHQARFAIDGLLMLPSCNTSKFGTEVFLYPQSLLEILCELCFQKKISEQCLQ